MSCRQKQGCGSGLDPDSETLWIRIRIGNRDSETLWIRIRIGNPVPDPGARKLRNFSGKNTLFSLKKNFFTTEKL
jgi:hypothetical protein